MAKVPVVAYLCSRCLSGREVAEVVEWVDRPEGHDGELEAVMVAGLCERCRPAESFVCPRCGFESFNPSDKTHRYCVRCHEFFD